MHLSDSGGAERKEFDAVLASGILSRAPSLVQFLSYICEMHFAGRAAEIKEYNIAVEALGRPADFDPKRDSIVRVEAHRLRKRLRTYYEQDGAGHPVRIEIPSGQYTPRFIRTVVEEPAAPVATGPAVPAALPLARAADASGTKRWFQAAVLGVIVTAALAAAWSWRSVARDSVWATGTPPEGPEIRIRAAGEMYADPFGRVWQADRFSTGGQERANPSAVRGTRDPQIYATYREGAFRYDIPIAPGVYELRLHFAEPLAGEETGSSGGEGTRILQVALNGNPLLRDFDIFSEVGAQRADVKAFKDVTPAADGKIHLEFSGSGSGAVLSAIEITPGIPGVMVPVRMVSRDTPYMDARGRFWSADQYVSGGKLVFRKQRLSASGDPELYRGERYGSLDYEIPVPPGRYTVILYFAETWFGQDHPGGGGAGQRLFNIMCNGVLLERELDILREAGGPDRGIRRIYRGVQPNAQGKIALALTPLRNYAELNALEVLDESN